MILLQIGSSYFDEFKSAAISNKKLDINLYYKFSNKIPKDLNWHSIYNNKEFIPTFTKKIFRQVENLY